MGSFQFPTHGLYLEFWTCICIQCVKPMIAPSAQQPQPQAHTDAARINTPSRASTRARPCPSSAPPPRAARASPALLDEIAFPPLLTADEHTPPPRALLAVCPACATRHCRGAHSPSPSPPTHLPLPGTYTASNAPCPVATHCSAGRAADWSLPAPGFFLAIVAEITV
ncbi:hypothetical protein B0H17DRAFT_1330842 [Mycena rosella]|uniref:Uncharacterized protein n=1 Tax=Mycena rosella TaxID=1033263 RepID=A0AAD7DI99_MYCRO|nr:hypothetical protein B0H17DRAFT_1330842 [Mycena rosella]